MPEIGRRELYCITTIPESGSTYEYMVEEACAGGAEIIQFRHKQEVTEETIKTARNLCAICRRFQTLFIVNDNPQLARDSDADGVHLGQDDTSVEHARSVIGKDKLIGLSAQTFQQAMKCQVQGADYIGFGPIFSTPIKPDVSPVGLQDIETLTQKIDIPVFVIGGITQDNIAEVIMSGARRVAVIRAVFSAPNIREAAGRMREQIASAKKERMYQQI